MSEPYCAYFLFTDLVDCAEDLAEVADRLEILAGTLRRMHRDGVVLQEEEGADGIRVGTSRSDLARKWGLTRERNDALPLGGR